MGPEGGNIDSHQALTYQLEGRLCPKSFSDGCWCLSIRGLPCSKIVYMLTMSGNQYFVSFVHVRLGLERVQSVEDKIQTDYLVKQNTRLPLDMRNSIGQQHHGQCGIQWAFAGKSQNCAVNINYTVAGVDTVTDLFRTFAWLLARLAILARAQSKTSARLGRSGHQTQSNCWSLVGKADRLGAGELPSHAWLTYAAAGGAGGSGVPAEDP